MSECGQQVCTVETRWSMSPIQADATLCERVPRVTPLEAKAYRFTGFHSPQAGVHS